MKKILIPTDFSDAANHAADLAARLAAKHGAELHLVHSVDVPDTWQDGRFTSAALANKSLREQRALYPEVQQRVGQARQDLEALSARLARKKVKVHYEIASNAAWEDVVRLAKVRKADLIVMGTRGAGALKEAFLGSNTQKVVRLAPMPVLTLHTAAPAPIANIAVFIDPLEKGLEKVLPKLLAPFKGERTRVHLVNVNTPGRFQDTDTALEMLRVVAKRIEPTVAIHTCDHYSVQEGALAFVRREGMDLIALPTHGRSGLRGYLNSSIAETIVNHFTVPVITMKLD
ncbi:MAG: universal stress protein [Flavobacteriales bacterium]